MQFSSGLDRQLNGYGLTTAHILYHSRFPLVHKFLDFWQDNLEGPLHSVRYSYQRLIGPNEWRRLDGEFKLH